MTSTERLIRARRGMVPELLSVSSGIELGVVIGRHKILDAAINRSSHQSYRENKESCRGGGGVPASYPQDFKRMKVSPRDLGTSRTSLSVLLTQP